MERTDVPGLVRRAQKTKRLHSAGSPGGNSPIGATRGSRPRQLAARLATVGASWQDIHAVVLTHTHSDHWNDRTFAHLHRRNLPVYCHADHHADLGASSPAFTIVLIVSP